MYMHLHVCIACWWKGHTSGSPLLGAGSNCRNFLFIVSFTSMIAAMFPAGNQRWLLLISQENSKCSDQQCFDMYNTFMMHAKQSLLTMQHKSTGAFVISADP